MKKILFLIVMTVAFAFAQDAEQSGRYELYKTQNMWMLRGSLHHHLPRNSSFVLVEHWQGILHKMGS